MMFETVRNFFRDEDGMGTVEVVVIVAVLVGLALVFRKQIFSLVNQIFDRVFQDAGGATANEADKTRTLP